MILFVLCLRFVFDFLYELVASYEVKDGFLQVAEWET